MIATSLWKVTRQPFDSTYDSYPHMLGNSAGILSAVLHYELSFVFLFFPRWITSCPHQNAETAPFIRSMAYKGDVINMYLVS